MKIGIDIRNIGKKRTGDETVFFNLTKNLALIDFENEYSLFTDITDRGTLEKIARDLGLENKNNFKIISLATMSRFSWNFWTVPKYLRKNPVDVYLTQYITPLFVPKKIKIVTIIHDISFNFFPQFIKISDLIFLKTLIPLALKRANKIIGVSKFTRDEIVKYYKIDSTKVDFIHNAVSDDFMELATGKKEIMDSEKKTVKEKYNLPEKFILYIGTLQPRKNLPLLIEAFMLLKNDSGNDLKLVIAGGRGHNYDKLIDKTIKENELGEDVFFPGFIPEMDKAAILAAAQVFCFPSLYEGFGIPILEAMSVGTPVVASDIAPHREIAAGAALFFNPNVVGELAEKIRELVKNDVVHDNFAEKGRKQALEFSWKKTAEKMVAVFESFD